MLWTKLNMGYFWHLKPSNSKVNSLILPEFELVRDFMPVQVICKTGIQTQLIFYGCSLKKSKFKEDSIKMLYHPDNIFSIVNLWENYCSRASNSKANCLIWPKI